MDAHSLHILLITIVISLQIVENALNEDQIVRKLNYIEERLNAENAFRRDDSKTFNSKLERIEELLKTFIDVKSGDLLRTKEHVEAGTEDITSGRRRPIEQEMLAIRKAFIQEKSENIRFRREARDNIAETLSFINESVIEIRDGLQYSLEQVGDDIRKDMNVNIKELVSHVNKNCLEIRDDLERKHIAAASVVIDNMDTVINYGLMKLERLFENNTCCMSDFEHRKFGNYSFIAVQNTTINRPEVFKSCAEILSIKRTLQSGLFHIAVNPGQSLQVYCDMETDGGGWIVFQHRQDGIVEFNRTWAEYKSGFGNISGEFWLGNEYIHLLTKQGPHELRIDMEDFDGDKAYAKYKYFKLGSEDDDYRLYTTGYSGDAGDDLGSFHHVAFSTTDKDLSSGHCTKYYPGGWWFNNCYNSNLNGHYSKQEYCIYERRKCIHWYNWRGYNRSLKLVEMKLR